MLGDRDALYYLGFAYLNGEGVKEDQTWALAYFMVASKFGHDRAGQQVEKAVAAISEEIEWEARNRADSLFSKITEQKEVE